MLVGAFVFANLLAIVTVFAAIEFDFSVGILDSYHDDNGGLNLRIEQIG